MTPPPIEANPLRITTARAIHHRPNNDSKINSVEVENGNSSSLAEPSSSSSIVLHRIVTSASSLLGTHNDADDGGDIVASIVLLLQSSSSVSSAVGDSNNNKLNSSSSRKTVLMVQRMDGTTVASFDLPSSSTTTSSTTYSTLVSASDDDDNDDLLNYYSINDNIIAEDRHRGGGRGGGTNNDSGTKAVRRGGGGGYNDTLLCWASFREEHSIGGGQSCSSTRKMLCALGNPETLLVYDVLGDTNHMNLFPSINTHNNTPAYATSASGIGDNITHDTVNTKKTKNARVDDGGGGGGGGPGGYTIPLPFRAQSIFPNGDDHTGGGGGLLIVRASSREDYAIAVNEHNEVGLLQQQHPVVGLQEGEINDVCDVNENDAGMVTQMGHRRRRSSSSTTPTGLSLPATPRSSLTRQQRQRCDSTDDGDDLLNENNDYGEEEEDHPSLEDPPVPLRYLEKGGSMFDNSSRGDAVVTETAMEDTSISGEFDNGVPCLFSLRHPLDEIHPLAVAVGGMTQQQRQKKGNVNNDNLVLFTNVTETLVFVGSPRLFHGSIPFHAMTTTSPLCVTYNERRNRHTFWSLSNVVHPMESLPLWRTTGRGAWQSSASVTSSPWVDTSKVDENEQRMVASENDADNSERQGAHMHDENDKDTDPVSQMRQQLQRQQGGGEQEIGAPSNFSDIHPEFALKKIFADDILPSALGGVGVENDDDNRKMTTIKSRQIFLATDLHARGDLVLCVFTPNSESGRGNMSTNLSSAHGGKSRNNERRDVDSCIASSAAILRCYSLHLPETLLLPSDVNACYHEKVVVPIQSASHLVDLSCSSAQPLRSIPIPLAPFAQNDGKASRMNHNSRRKKTSRFHSQDRDTFATDILIVPKWQNGRSQSIIRLYRAGIIHVADFTLPQATLEAVNLSSSMSAPPAIYLKNAVGNRADVSVLYSDLLSAGEGIRTKKRKYSPAAIVRASFSLLMNTSAVTETALRTIESSLVYNCDPHTQSALLPSHARTYRDENEQFLASTWGVSLSLLIRSDVVRLFQQTSSIGRSNVIPKNVEDAGWYSLTVVLLNLFGVKHTSDKEQAVAHIHQTGKKFKKQTSTAWETLLQSEYHSSFCAGEGEILFGGIDDLWEDSVQKIGLSNSDGEFLAELLSVLAYVTQLESDATNKDVGNNNGSTYSSSFRRIMFDSLHLLHEESRLVSRSRGFAWTLRLGTFLMHVAKQMNPMMLDYEDHYHRILGTSRCQSNACTSCFTMNDEKQRLSNFAVSPCIMTSLDCLIQLDSEAYSLEDALYRVAGYSALFQYELNGVLSYTWMVLRLFMIRFDRKNILSDSNSVIGSELSQSHRERAAILAMLDEGIYHPLQLQDELPMGVALPLLEAVFSCRLDPPHVDSTGEFWPTAAYDLVGRNDLAEFLSLSGDESSQRTHLVDNTSPSDDPDNDGLLGLDDFASLTFPDNRIREAARLLRSSHPLFLNAPRPVELSDHDYERSKQEKLLLLCRRSISLPLGRGMLTLGTHKALSSEQLLIPNIVLAGRVPPMNGTLALDMTACPSNFRVWPEFHNGVAAGLRLPQATKDNRARAVTRTWIKFNKPVHTSDSNSPSYSHGGFLMALGLRGLLSALTTTDLTDYLTQGIITTTVGLFLGLSSNLRGTCDPSVSKMLCLHVPSLLPPSFLPMDLASPVQAAAVAAIGLLYLGSSHRLMTEFLLNEIGRPPVKDQNSTDREGFALVCGLSLGMVNLSRGESTISGLEDLHIEDRLQRFISGVPDGSESYGYRVNQGDTDRNSRIYESNSFNRDITAPGATLAIGLMYIRSHNVSVAASLQLPDTHFLLDYIRPDLLGLRVISRSLILWHDIQPTSDWINAQVPIIVKQSITLMKDAAVRVMKIDNAHETYDQAETQRCNRTTDFDPNAIRQANAHIIAGACFSLGLKYAGSANRFAATAIIERTLWFLELRDNKDVVTLTQRPDNSTLITCLCTAAISLAMVMAGTGDLDSFRLFRALRWKCDDNTLYGAHMAFGAAIGLLFLGGGKCSLGSNPEDVAMLIASFYPHLPASSSDNQYHLQALRHLYVLASRKRILEACDVDSNEKACIPIELRVADSDDVALASTPFLVANGTSFMQLSSKSDRYYPIVINMSDWNARSHLPTLFVKQRSGHLSYLQDPNGLLSLSLHQGGSTDSLMKSIKLFSDAAILTTFAKYFCISSFDDDRSFESFCSDIAYECMKEGKTDDALVMILRVFRLIDSFGPRSRVGIENIWDAKLITTFSTTSTSLLINRELLSLLRERVDDSFHASLPSLAFRCRKWWERRNNHFGAVLIWNEVPLMSSS